MSYFDSANRKMKAHLYYSTSNTQVPDANVQSFSVSESMCNGQQISLGTTNSSQLDISLINVSSTIKANVYKGQRLKLTLEAFESNGQSLTENIGVYYVDSAEWSKTRNNTYNCTITAYDGMCKLEKIFTSTGLPIGTNTFAIRTIINAISQQCGISYNSSEWSNSITVTSYPEETTCRTLVGYLASLQGCCAVFDENGNLSARWYTSYNKDITVAEQYMDGLSLFTDSNNASMTISILQSGTSDEVLVAPSGSSTGVVGTAISFENPYIVGTSGQTYLNNIYSSRVRSNGQYLITFRPLSVKWRGDPSIRLGSIVGAYDISGELFTCYVMEKKIEFDGGLYEEYTCYGENDSTIAFSKNSKMQSLNRKFTAMEEAIAEATNIIPQTAGSVFEFISANDPSNPNKNAGFKLYNTVSNELIMCTSHGIGFSSNGGTSFDAAAIYINSDGVGCINGQKIVAGSINCNTLATGKIIKRDNEGTEQGISYFDLDDGSLKIGASGVSRYLYLNEGNISFMRDASNSFGGLAPNGTKLQLFYKDSSGNSDGVSIGYNGDGGLGNIAIFNKDVITNTVKTVTNPISDFCGFEHHRKVGTSPNLRDCIIKPGVGTYSDTISQRMTTHWTNISYTEPVIEGVTYRAYKHQTIPTDVFWFYPPSSASSVHIEFSAYCTKTTTVQIDYQPTSGGERTVLETVSFPSGAVGSVNRNYSIPSNARCVNIRMNTTGTSSSTTWFGVNESSISCTQTIEGGLSAALECGENVMISGALTYQVRSRLDVYDHSWYDTGEVRVKYTNESGDCKWSYGSNKMISENHNTLEFRDDGLYYSGRKLAYVN